MDFKSFGAAAYAKAGKKDDKDSKGKKQATGEVIRGGNQGAKPVSFQAFSKSEKVSNEATDSKIEKPLSDKKISAPSWAKISKSDANPIGRAPTTERTATDSGSLNTKGGAHIKGGAATNSGSLNTKGGAHTKGGAATKAGSSPSAGGGATIDFTSNIKPSPSQRLENATDYLKSGGLLKVPVTESKDGKDSTYRKVAKFLVLIGEDEAAKVLPLLSEKQIERIILEISSIRTVSNEEAAVIFEEFNGIVKQVKQQGGVETAREMLTKAYGAKRADEMIKKAMPLEGKVPFSYLNDLDTERIMLLLKDENVGVQALVLSHINPKKSAKVINLMDPEAKKEIVMRLAKMEPVSPEVLRRIDQGMHEKSLNLTVEESENLDGRNALAQILKKMDVSAENDILSTLADEDPDLGQDLRSRLFTLEDVVNADDKYIQGRLREMTEIDIAYLVAGKPDDFKEKILSNISANRRAEVRAQDEIYATKRRSDVDKITGQFLSKLRRAYEDGDLIIHNRNDEEFV